MTDYADLDGIHLPVPGGGEVPHRIDETRALGEPAIGLFPDQPGGSRGPATAFDLTSIDGLEGTDMRVLSPSDAASSPIDPISTTLVRGPHTYRADWTDGFFPPTLPVDAGTSRLVQNRDWQYPVWGDLHLGNFATELEERQRFQTSTISRAFVPERIETHGWAVSLTMEEQARAMGSADWIARKLSLPSYIVRRRLEFKTRDLLLDTTAGAVYALGHVTNLAPGAEWNNGGDMKATLEPLIRALASKVHVTRQTDIRLRMTEATFSAAMQDAGFIAHNQGIRLVDNSNRSFLTGAMAQYLGVADVEVFNATDDTGREMFGDVCWGYTQGPNMQEYDTDYGHERWSARFQANDGFALEPWEDRGTRETYSAYMREYKNAVLNSDCAFLVTNTSATE